MRKLMEVLEQCETDSDRRWYRILSGEGTGESALLENGVLRWRSREENRFWEQHADALWQMEDGESLELAQRRILAEVIGSEPELMICGGGHIAAALIRLAKMSGWYVSVLEDRPMFADHARLAGADRVMCEKYRAGLIHMGSKKQTCFVIATRGHRSDQTCLEQICGMPHAYIGMLGSRRRTAVVKKEAILHGVDPEVLETVYAPIGLDIGAETPEEIAVSIMAQLIQIKRKRHLKAAFSAEIQTELFRSEVPYGERVLAEIVSRKGSAPREIGTKMIICKNADLIGTIGGGCVEADVIQKARALMTDGEQQTQLFWENMTAEEAEDAGMVCGGKMELFLEKI